MSTTNKRHSLQKKLLKREVRRNRSASYPLKASPLYGLKSLHRLASLLKISVEELRQASTEPTYRRFVDDSAVGKPPRNIQEPVGLTLTIHYRFVRLLDRVERPEFLHSATKSRSHITNAEQHIGSKAMAATDIASFYENTSVAHLKAFFLQDLHWARDLATLMANALTVDGHLATGSACSPLLSYFTHRRMFERIEGTCSAAGVTMTLYVDDLTISGERATKTLLYRIKGELLRSGLRSHKDRVAPKGRPMVVTGATPASDRLLLRNKHRRSIVELIRLYSRGIGSTQVSLAGKLASARQTDPRGAAPLLAAYLTAVGAQRVEEAAESRAERPSGPEEDQE